MKSGVPFLIIFFFALTTCVNKIKPPVQRPHAVIISPDENGVTKNISEITLQWKGNNNESDFRYKLEPSSNTWSSWRDTTQVTFSKLDEGAYSFMLQERYPSGYEQPDTTVRNFSVNAVVGPALLLAPQEYGGTKGDSFVIEVYADEVENLLGFSVEINFDEELLSLQSIREDESFFSANTEDVIVTNDADDQIQEMNEKGVVNTDAVRLGGEPMGIDGSGNLLHLTFTAEKSGEAILSFNEDAPCMLRNADNVDILIKKFRGARITIN